jgi:ankyrin repeat protein
MSAKLDAVDLSSANTALHLACIHGHCEIVEMLATEMTFEQTFNKPNRQGQKAIDIAQEKVIELQM